MIAKRALATALVSATSTLLLIAACVGEDPSIIVLPTPEAGADDTSTGPDKDGASKDGGSDASSTCANCTTLVPKGPAVVGRMILADGFLYYTEGSTISRVPTDGSGGPSKLVDFGGEIENLAAGGSL